MKKAMGGYSMTAKSGKKFPDLTGDGKVTRADILKGRGVFKSGGKMQTGGKMKDPAVQMMLHKKKKTTKPAAPVAPKKKRYVYGNYMKNGGTVSMQLGSYGRQFGKNYSGKGGGAKGMKKCKMGC